VIREADKDGAVTVCGGGSRARTVYVSKLNHVELQMVTDVNNVANNYVFLFLYEGSPRGVHLLRQRFSGWFNQSTSQN